MVAGRQVTRRDGRFGTVSAASTAMRPRTSGLSRNFYSEEGRIMSRTIPFLDPILSALLYGYVALAYPLWMVVDQNVVVGIGTTVTQKAKTVTAKTSTTPGLRNRAAASTRAGFMLTLERTFRSTNGCM